MVAKYLRFVFGYFALNLSSALEYRGAFLAQMLGMMLNDLVFFIFWALFFDRFPLVGGWGVQDVLLLYAVAATSVGLGIALFGNCTRLATVIVQGQLDYYLSLPKATLLHVLISRMGMSGWGDVAFGVLAFAFFGPHSLPSVVLWLVLLLSSTTIFVAFMVIAGSLAFFIGSAEAAAFQAFQAVITFGVYPGGIYQGWVRVLIFTLIPAGFISHLPVELLRRFDPLLFAGLLGVAVLSLGLAVLVFRVGLRRYESGNLVVLRG
jgi:ABC-2 type transport system permease protein